MPIKVGDTISVYEVELADGQFARVRAASPEDAEAKAAYKGALPAYYEVKMVRVLGKVAKVKTDASGKQMYQLEETKPMTGEQG